MTGVLPPPEESRRGRRLRGPAAFEVATWLGLAIGIGFLRLRGLNVDWVAVEYTIPPLVLPVAQALGSGVLLYGAWTLARGGSLARYLRTVVSPNWLLLSVRIATACLLFTFTYFWMKVSVPLVNHALWDDALWRVDRLVHLGVQPSIFWTEIVEGTPIAALLETWYGAWITTMMLGLGFFCAVPQAEERRRFMLSTVLLWLVGAWLYTALPAVGPVYAYGEVWQGSEDMPGARAAQALLWENYETMLRGRREPLARFNPTRGVAALPSLHVAGHWLLMLWTRRLARPLFVPAALATALTFLGSLATGWHYALDGYAGVALAQGAYWLSCRDEDTPGGDVGRGSAQRPRYARWP